MSRRTWCAFQARWASKRPPSRPPRATRWTRPRRPRRGAVSAGHASLTAVASGGAGQGSAGAGVSGRRAAAVTRDGRGRLGRGSHRRRPRVLPHPHELRRDVVPLLTHVKHSRSTAFYGRRRTDTARRALTSFGPNSTIRRGRRDRPPRAPGTAPPPRGRGSLLRRGPRRARSARRLSRAGGDGARGPRPPRGAERPLAGGAPAGRGRPRRRRSTAAPSTRSRP